MLTSILRPDNSASDTSLIPRDAEDGAGMPADQPLARLLVSDDSTDIQKLYRLLLPQYGFDVITTPSGYGAMTVDVCRIYLPDLVISDVNKPDMSGYDVCLAIRNDPQTAHIPFLFVSAMHETLDRRRAYAAGVDAYILKPFLVEGLLYHIAALLAPSNHVLALPGVGQYHPVTGLPGPQSLSRMLPDLTRGDHWVALVLTITGFDVLPQRMYDQSMADHLLLMLTTLARQLLGSRSRGNVTLAHHAYGQHVILIGDACSIEGLYPDLRDAFVAKACRLFHPESGMAAQPELLYQWIDARYGSIPHRQALWDILKHIPFVR